jgi:hypothetical protein
MSNKRPILQTSIPKNDADNASVGPIPPIPRIRQKWQIDKRRWEHGNYIPHPTPGNANRCVWHSAYLSQLMDMYIIVINTMNEKYPKNKIKWNSNDKIFHNLSRVLYHCSSKYISEYLDRPLEEIESKDWETESKDGESEKTIVSSEEGMSQSDLQ